MRAQRLRGIMPLAVGGMLVAALAATPSGAHANPVSTTPSSGAVVRAVDATQTAPNPDWIAELPDEVNEELNGPKVFDCANNRAAQQHPCDVRATFDGPLTPLPDQLDDPSGNVFELRDGNGNLVSGRVTFVDSTRTTTSRSQVATLIPGADTIVFTPGTFAGETFTPGALAAGTYTATAKLTSWDGHAVNCVEPNAEGDPPVANCYYWSFIVAPAPVTPTIDPLPASADHRNLEVTGTAEPGSTIEVIRPGEDGDGHPTEKVIGKGATDVLGRYSVVAGLAKPNDTFFVRATSAPITLDEKNPVDDDDDPETPPVPQPPHADSASVSISVSVTDDTAAPEVELHTPHDLIQAGDHPVMEGVAQDNDEVSQLQIVVKDVLGAVVAAGPDTYQVTSEVAPVVHWSIHFSAIGRFTVTIKGADPSGNVTPDDGRVETTYTITTADLLE